MRKTIVLALGVLALSVLACTFSLPGTTETEAPPPPSNVLLQDDFSSSSTGWEVGDYDIGRVGYENGYYFVNAIEQGSIMWGLSGSAYGDTIITVDATQVSAPGNNNNSYGVGCRFTSSDQPDGYLFRISGDGYFAIQIVRGGETTAIVDWTTSSAINQGNKTNRLKVICDGSDFRFEVNGTLMDQVSDSSFTYGNVILAASTFESEQTEIHFDNIVISKP
ncbi:MAG: hypothetical protein FJZ96_15375 [Chloroflexi bacterium]|nr:hypothetical protein [Chloroflexota bacterium]